VLSVCINCIALAMGGGSGNVGGSVGGGVSGGLTLGVFSASILQVLWECVLPTALVQSRYALVFCLLY